MSLNASDSALPARYNPEAGWAQGLHIAISGLIGAGKSTLCEALSAALHLPAYYEPVIDNEYLNDFYQDQERYGFPLQVYLLNQRFRQQQQIIWGARGGIQDRSIYEDSIFAKMLWKSGKMSERDYRTYVSLFQNMSNFMRKPSVIVHLDVSPKESLRRIRERNRGMETGIPLAYLEQLRSGYEEFLADISKTIPVIKVNWESFKSTEEMVQMIRREFSKLSTIHTVDWHDHTDEDEQALSKQE